MKHHSRTEQSIKNIVIGIGGQVFSLIIGFISRMCFVQFLSAEYLGLNGLFSNILSVLSLTELGVGTAIGYALYKPLANNDEKQISALMNYFAHAYRIIGISVFLLGIFMIPFLHLIIEEPKTIEENIYLIYFIFLFNSASSYFFSYKSTLLICDQKNYVVLFYNYVFNFVQNVAQIMILFFTRSYLLYLFVQVLCNLIFNFAISSVVNNKYLFLKSYKREKIDSKTKIALIKNIRALVLTKISGMIVNNTDNIIITYFNGLSMVGIQSNYTLLINTLNTILNQIFNGLTASVGNFNALESHERSYDMFNIINFLNYWLYSWCSISFVLLADDIVKLCFGTSYVLPKSVIIIMAINFYTVGMQNAIWTYRGTLGLFRYGRYLQFLTAILNLILSIILGHSFGLFGILIATLFSRMFTNLWYDPYAIFKYGLKVSPLIYFKKYLIYLISSLFGYFSTYLTISFLGINLFLKLIICIIVPNIISTCLFFKSKEFKFLWKKCRMILYAFLIHR